VKQITYRVPLGYRYFSLHATQQDWLTAGRHGALFPSLVGIGRVAPESDETVVRVATVVAGSVRASVGKHVIVVVRMSVRLLGRPWLTGSAADRLSFVAHVLMSRRWQYAVSHTCGITETHYSLCSCNILASKVNILGFQVLFTTCTIYKNHIQFHISIVST